MTCPYLYNDGKEDYCSFCGEYHPEYCPLNEGDNCILFREHDFEREIIE